MTTTSAFDATGTGYATATSTGDIGGMSGMGGAGGTGGADGVGGNATSSAIVIGVPNAVVSSNSYPPTDTACQFTA